MWIGLLVESYTPYLELKVGRLLQASIVDVHVCQSWALQMLQPPSSAHVAVTSYVGCGPSCATHLYLTRTESGSSTLH